MAVWLVNKIMVWGLPCCGTFLIYEAIITTKQAFVKTKITRCFNIIFFFHVFSLGNLMQGIYCITTTDCQSQKYIQDVSWRLAIVTTFRVEAQPLKIPRRPSQGWQRRESWLTGGGGVNFLMTFQAVAWRLRGVESEMSQQQRRQQSAVTEGASSWKLVGYWWKPEMKYGRMRC